MYYYSLNQTCQAHGWNEKLHKKSCKLLQDPDLRGIIILDWGQFDKHISFPFSVNTVEFAASTRNVEEAPNVSKAAIQACTRRGV